MAGINSNRAQSGQKNTLVSSKRAEEILKKYKNIKTPGAFSNVKYFLKGLEEEGVKTRKKEKRGRKPRKLTQSMLKNVLEQDITYQVSRSLRKHFERRKIISLGLNELWEGDIGIVGPSRFSTSESGEKKNRYFLLFVDTFSKMSFAHGLQNKSAQEVLAAFKKIVQDLKPPYSQPSTILVDKGREFDNVSFKEYLKKHGVYLSLTSAATKAQVAER